MLRIDRHHSYNPFRMCYVTEDQENSHGNFTYRIHTCDYTTPSILTYYDWVVQVREVLFYWVLSRTDT